MKIQSHQLIRLYLTPQLSILLLFFTPDPGPFQQIQAIVWKMMQDPIWKMKIQLRPLLIWSVISITIIHCTIVSFGRTGEEYLS
jgi:hypothetical protein